MKASFVIAMQETEPALWYIEARLRTDGLDAQTAQEISLVQLEGWLAVVRAFANGNAAAKCEIGAGGIDAYRGTSGFRCTISREGLKFLVQIGVRDQCRQLGNTECCMEAQSYFVTEQVLTDNFCTELAQVLLNRAGTVTLEEAGSYSFIAA